VTVPGVCSSICGSKEPQASFNKVPLNFAFSRLEPSSLKFSLGICLVSGRTLMTKNIIYYLFKKRAKIMNLTKYGLRSEVRYLKCLILGV